MKRSIAKKGVGATPDDYLEMVKNFPLRPLRNEDEYDRAVEIHRGLLARADRPGLTEGESDYADALVQFIGKYESNNYPPGKDKISPLELLKYLMEQNSINTTELGELLGSGRGHASLIVNGKRELSKANIRTLADRFKVSPAAFL